MGSDYFLNSRKATLANRAYCVENEAGFVGYGPNQWGLTACDGPSGKDTIINGTPTEILAVQSPGCFGSPRQ